MCRMGNAPTSAPLERVPLEQAEMQRPSNGRTSGSHSWREVEACGGESSTNGEHAEVLNGGETP